MLIGLLIILGCLGKANAFATPSSDFLHGIDGSSVATGYSHVCALEQRPGNHVGGRVQCWGSEHKEHAFETAPTDMDFVQLVAGADFTCGLTPEQTVLCWGTIEGYLPGLFEQITASSFDNSVCGVLTDGKLFCSGHSTLYPRKTAEFEQRFVQISCSKNHCCALDLNAYPHCWGEMTQMKEVVPPQITYSQYVAATTGPGVDVNILQLNEDAQDALKRRKRANDEDFESDPNAKSADSEGDEEVAKIQFRQISVGEGQSCGITLLGAHLQCWGGHTKKALQSPGPYRQVSVGSKGVCAITAETEASDVNQTAPEVVLATPTKYKRKKTSQERERTREADKLHCWGFADSMVFYSGDTDAETLHWDQVIVGATAVCAVTMDSELKCWGFGDMLPEEVTDRPPSFYVA